MPVTESIRFETIVDKVEVAVVFTAPRVVVALDKSNIPEMLVVPVRFRFESSEIEVVAVIPFTVEVMVFPVLVAKSKVFVVEEASNVLVFTSMTSPVTGSRTNTVFDPVVVAFIGDKVRLEILVVANCAVPVAVIFPVNTEPKFAIEA